ncbi:MAG: bifunctional diguanylate cyclase/phosphodiesterase [Burkholderiales bacterium]|nr:bifunctional diguanylate cyclase/phosphodiesterase [Burkholderiales bacterium]MDE1926770.1 bifunctional diguanylate cyclase/phosphodiesterase [Burkholderiales bacterium]MDE2159896.1 bifunctional diguanylate cyclase/phosphodiesterase [Burkholderiales bacterium]MDE2503846.1 bifunctional diguanylate cyclase/phosphodiesterase [Burkholderiales bacterium]
MAPLATDLFSLLHSDASTWLLSATVLGALAQLWRAERARSQLRRRLSAANSRLDQAHTHDSLTGLILRDGFESELDRAVAACDSGRGALALLCVGLDNFRPLNDGYGHRVGDAVLVEVGQRLSALAAPHGVVSRLGGDEFALLLALPLAAACEAAQQILQSLQQPYAAEGLNLRLGASVGIAAYPEQGSRPRLLANASMAMRTVKLGGGGAHACYHPAMSVDVREQAELVQDLRQALARRELQLYYQPKIDARSLQVTGAEALLRWQHPRRGMVSPAVFVPLAERYGLIVEIGRWVIEEACRQAAEWREQGLRMRVAINISGHQLRHDDLVDHLQAMLERHGIRPQRLTCEITETVAMEDTGVTRAAFERLRQAGLRVSIDDFGTGHSSLATLRRLPAAELKIDRAFVSDLASGERATTIVQTIVQMAHQLGLRVVAEGVETTSQRDQLVALGCDELQGYLFAKPMTAVALALWAGGDDDGHVDRAFRPSLFDPTAPAELSS